MGTIYVDEIKHQSAQGSGTITIGASGETVAVASGSNFSTTGIDDNATSTAITINSSENVGIGTTSPLGKFVVSNGTDNNFEIFMTNPGGGSDTTLQAFNRSGSVYKDLYYSSLNQYFLTSGSERMRIASNGNVLVGNTNNGTLANLEVRNSIGMQDDSFYTIELGKGQSGSFSTITLTFQANYYAAQTIIEAQMFGYNSIYLDHVMGSYAGGGAVVMRNNASGATVTFSTTATGTPYVSNFNYVISASVTHPIVKYKISRGGGNGDGFVTKPTITFS